MTQRYENIMVAVDGSKADLAFIKGVQSALRNQAKLTIAHVIDTRALQSIFSIRCRSLRRVTSRGHKG